MKIKTCHICLEEAKKCFKLKNYNKCISCNIYICKKCMNDLLIYYDNNKCSLCKENFIIDTENNYNIHFFIREKWNCLILYCQFKLEYLKDFMNKYMLLLNTFIKKIYDIFKKFILIVIIYFCLTLLGLIYILISNSLTEKFSEKNFNTTFIDKWYIILPNTGILVICIIVLVMILLINFGNCIKNMDWDTIV